MAQSEPRIVYLKPKIGPLQKIISLHEAAPERLCIAADLEPELAPPPVPDTPAPNVLQAGPALKSDADLLAAMDGMLSIQQPATIFPVKHHSLLHNGTMLHNGHHNGLHNGHHNGELHHVNGYGPCSVDEPPPSFSRLPPDGHEFPPSYMEPVPPPPGSKSRRQDERSQKSVRDKIALFSCASVNGEVSECAEPPSPVSAAPSQLARFRSSEDVRSSGPASMSAMERAVSTVDLQTCAPPVPRFSTLPRKPGACTPAQLQQASVNNTMGVGRALSFSHGRSQSLVDVGPPRAAPSSLTALLEQRRRGMSKLRGLVIPERPELQGAPASLDLPEIRSRELLNCKVPSTRPQHVPVETRAATVQMCVPQQQPPQHLLPALPTMPKYSPAFKRKNFSLLESGKTVGEIPPPQIVQPVSQPPPEQPSHPPPPPPQQQQQQPLRPADTYERSFAHYFNCKPDSMQMSSHLQTSSGEPKSLESLSSPRSDAGSSLGDDEDEADSLRRHCGEDSDSAVSSASSPPPIRGGDELSRTLSDTSSTLSGGSSSRVLKAQSVEATNRKNVLASARSSSGRGGVGSPLIHRKFSDEEEEEEGEEQNPLLPPRELPLPAGQQVVKVAYLDEVCEVEIMPEVAPRTIVLSETIMHSSQPLRVTELRPKSSPAPPPAPSSAPPSLPPQVQEICVSSRSLQVSAAPPALAPRSTPPPAREPTPPTPLTPPPPALPATPEPTTDLTDSIKSPERKVSRPRSLEPATHVQSRREAHRESRELREPRETPSRPAAVPRASRQEQVQNFRDIADRWQLMAETAAPPAPPTPVVTPVPQASPRTAPAKPGRRSASVTDIRKAFERNPAASAGGLAPAAVHARVSSLDSSCSSGAGGDPEVAGPACSPRALLSSANSMEQLGSISSLASTTSLISQQELQGLLDEAAAEEGAPGGELQVVLLHRDSAASSVGITLAGGADYEARDITVHKVLAGSPAERDGRVQKGDRILSINGRSMKGLTHREALQIIKAPRPEVVLVVARGGRGDSLLAEEPCCTTPTACSPSSPPAPRPAASEEPQVAATTPTSPGAGAPQLVTLSKDGAGLGFSLEGGKDSPLGDRPLTVKKVFTGGAAEKSGLLHAGDHLLAVNGVDVSTMSRIEAWGLMKRLPAGPVTLLVRPV